MTDKEIDELATEALFSRDAAERERAVRSLVEQLRETRALAGRVNREWGSAYRWADRWKFLAKRLRARSGLTTVRGEEDRRMAKPSIGRIVHYTNLGDRDGRFPPTVQAALVTGVNEDGTVSLHIFYRTGQFDLPTVAQTDAPAGSEEARGHWCWPARVE